MNELVRAVLAALPGGAETEVVDILARALHAAAELTGHEGAEAERVVAAGLAFLRRRLEGDYEIDEFGFDREFTELVYLPVLRPLYRRWFRVEVRGIEHVPAEGGALVVSNHSGTIPIDTLMTAVAIHDEHPAHRILRPLGADLVFALPIVGEYARRAGATLASHDDAGRLLAGGEIVGVWPEGFKGVGKTYANRYRLQRFGRGGFVATALRAKVPIVPCSVVGAEEAYPMIADLRPLARLLGFPYFPITPTFPFLGPLGAVPLPSKWIIEFGAPVDTGRLGPDAADDPLTVFDLTDEVRETIQRTLHGLLARRGSTFP
ncbi:lysophospholipid acyltransferase family protein [Mobilicoccus pelagius]|uniref:Putative acyltransferase n=1 Tax=Mobilicoccus pelagius NBRC 104925 TaxID=1089455 RepID=H5US32_9MICO|nr:lysophospholipid acyltransferase family protein [Mobilicoccus pelagius]GAB48540.1 putative acyltransferase [Mobilicoccus pelagius NBRC 104925]